MKHARPAVALALVATLVAAGSAEAATAKKKVVKKPVPVCKLVTDAPGDAYPVNVGDPVPPQGTSDDAMDITSVDIAANANTITGVLRVKKLAATSTNAPTGINWSVLFTVGKTAFTLAAHADPTGKISYDASYATAAGGSLYPGNMQGRFDTVKNEIHISVPIATLAKQEGVPLKSKVTAIGGTAGPEILVPEATGKLGGGTFFSDSLTDDDTTAGKDYTTGTLSCVTPGK